MVQVSYFSQREVIAITQGKIEMIKCGYFITRENHFTEGNWDWFRENNILSKENDVISSKLIEITWGKVIFPSKKIYYT